MLVLGLSKNDKILITDEKTGQTIEIKVTEIFIHPTLGRGIKLSFDADRQYSIMRTELLDKKLNDK